LTSWFTRVLLGLLSLTGLAVTGCSGPEADHRAVASAQLRDAQEISVVAHRTNLVFVTASGTSHQYPTGPLSPGDRILGRDDLQQHGSHIGSDYEVCTVTFALNILCDDMIDLTNVGQLHVIWAFQWPASGTTGPTSWSGVVDGGTGGYENALGGFQARALPGGDLNITVHISRPT
jgi:hypothetical protein